MGNRLHFKQKQAFQSGYQSVTSQDLPVQNDVLGIDFGILTLQKGQEHTETLTCEGAWVLMSGQVAIEINHPEVKTITQTISRQSLFEESPFCVHIPQHSTLKLKAISTTAELAVSKTLNSDFFEPHIFQPNECPTEYRGDGLAQGTCLREVRLIFDKKNRPTSNLVVGEVVNYPGRWSSYPPHHHAQPEIYHYRFTEPQGYGHAELGESVEKVFDKSTVVISGGLDHGQVSAPGYGMYYLWVIRHLKDSPYTGFEFAPEHKWLLDPQNQGWKPKPQR